MNTKPKTEKPPAGIDAVDEDETAAPPPSSPLRQAVPARPNLDALRPNCGACQCSHFPLAEEDAWGECRAEPPKMQIIATPPKIAGQGPIYQPLSAWPPIQRQQWCITGFMLKSGLGQ